MNDTQYNLQFDKLCSVLKLGEIISVPEAVSGGLLHRMFAITTTQGKYAVKALNPKIMLRPAVIQNYINSEKIAGIAADTIPVLPAKEIDGSILHLIDKQYYLVFDWVEGRSMKAKEITLIHCIKMGAILAKLHRIDFSDLHIKKESSDHKQPIDWNCYLLKGIEDHLPWADLLSGNLNNLISWNAKAINSSRILESDMKISHRDLDAKNVMWINSNPIVIDWEAAGYINPLQELTETAIYWSENEEGNIEKEKFIAFINEYQKVSGTLQADWKTVLENGFIGKMEWLEYNLKRSLWLECSDDSEQKLGTEQVVGTLEAIRRYSEIINTIECWLYET